MVETIPQSNITVHGIFKTTFVATDRGIKYVIRNVIIERKLKDFLKCLLEDITGRNIFNLQMSLGGYHWGKYF